MNTTDTATWPVVVRTDVRRIDVTGADRLKYLEDVTSQAMDQISAGQVSAALTLDAKGLPQAMFDVVVLADRVALLAPDDEVAATIMNVLATRTFLADATFTETDDVIVSLRGPGSDQVAEAATLSTREGTVRPAGDELYVIGQDQGQVDVFGPARLIDQIVAGLEADGARLGTNEDLDQWRVDAAVPAWGTEVTAPHLPEEAGLLPTHVNLGKGCYPGQEAVARMWMLGRPRRRLARLVAQAGELRAGWQAGAGRKTVSVTTVSRDGGSALAYVPTDAVVGDTFEADEVRVAVAELVGASENPPGHDPAMNRRRDQRAATNSQS